MEHFHFHFLKIVVGTIVFSLFPTYGHGQISPTAQDSIPEVHWGSAHGLHSSANPSEWIGDSTTLQNDTLPGGRTLKEPDIPRANLHTAESANSTKGTLYETGLATYYSAKTHGRMMANGQRYHRDQLFCAHKKLPFGTHIRVVNKKNGKEVVVEVRDRGPFAKGRVIDLSNKAAAAIGMLRDGVVPVELWVLPDPKKSTEK